MLILDSPLMANIEVQFSHTDSAEVTTNAKG
jgi:hypothetical protein